MMRRADAETVLEYLRHGRTIAQVEQHTGWRAHGIRKLVARQPGWIVAGGRVIIPRPDDRASGVHVVEVHQGAEPRGAAVLMAEMKGQREELGLTWPETLAGVGISESTLDNLRKGKASMRTRRLIEAWLVRTAPKVST